MCDRGEFSLAKTRVCFPALRKQKKKQNLLLPARKITSIKVVQYPLD